MLLGFVLVFFLLYLEAFLWGFSCFIQVVVLWGFWFVFFLLKIESHKQIKLKLNKYWRKAFICISRLLFSH